MLGVKVKLIRASRVDEDISKLNNNIISDGRGFQVDVKKLASKCKNVDKDIHVLVHKELSDSMHKFNH